MKVTLSCTTRSDKGKNAAGRLRRAGSIPGNIISDGKAESISFPVLDFQKLVQNGLRRSSLIEMQPQNGSPFQVVVKEIQRHPVSGNTLHVDFYKVTEGRKLQVDVALIATGVAKGQKMGGALEQHLRSVKIKSIPANLLDFVEIDITNLGVGEAISLSDLKLPEGWDILTKGNPLVCRIARSRTTTQSEAAAS